MLVVLVGVCVVDEVVVLVGVAEDVLDACLSEQECVVPSAFTSDLFAQQDLVSFLSLQHFLSANIVPETNRANAKKITFFIFLYILIRSKLLYYLD